MSAILLSCFGSSLVRAHEANPEIPPKSYLEGREYQVFPELNVHEFKTGAFQSSFEQYIADLMPYRDDILLANAKLQRGVISLANLPLKYEAYPTFFGSYYLCCPDYKAIVETPSKKADISNLEATRQLLANAIEQHPAIDWRIALVDRSRTSPGNPAHNLVSEPADYSFYKAELLDKLPPSCAVIDLSIDGSTNYFEQYYRTDHHWNAEGSFNAFRLITENARGNTSNQAKITLSLKVPSSDPKPETAYQPNTQINCMTRTSYPILKRLSSTENRRALHGSSQDLTQPIAATLKQPNSRMSMQVIIIVT